MAVFDRDDTLIEDKPGLKEVEDIKWLPGRIQTLVELTKRGFDIAIATNQGAVAKKAISIEEVTNLHNYIAQYLLNLKINLTSIAFCPHHPNSKESLVTECNCRKPAPGLLEEIYFMNGSVHKKIYFFGNSKSDMEAAKRFRKPKIKGVLVQPSDNFANLVLNEVDL